MKILFLTEEFPPVSSGGSGIVAYNLDLEFETKEGGKFVRIYKVL